MSNLKQRIERILELRAKATPGPWHWESDPVKGDPLNRLRFQVLALGRTITQMYYSGHEGAQAETDAKLVAVTHEMADLLAELLPMVDDAARLDWANAHLATVRCSVSQECPIEYIDEQGYIKNAIGHDLREAIDAAIDAQMNKENTND